MNKFGIKAALAATLVAATAILAACGGYTTISIGGNIYGLATSGLVIANAGERLSIGATQTTYTFSKQIDTHGTYNVTVEAQPQRYTCAISGATGTATGVAISTINIFCSINTYNVGGTINGLTADGLQLINGADTVVPVNGATTFTFGTKVADSTVYGVTVLAQPAGQTCTVVNGTAYMGSSDVTNIVVNCVNNPS